MGAFLFGAFVGFFLGYIACAVLVHANRDRGDGN